MKCRGFPQCDAETLSAFVYDDIFPASPLYLSSADKLHLRQVSFGCAYNLYAGFHQLIYCPHNIHPISGYSRGFLNKNYICRILLCSRYDMEWCEEHRVENEEIIAEQRIGVI
jgi:hypothetical protein